MNKFAAILVVYLLSGVSLAPSAFSAETAPIYVVDVQEVICKSALGKGAKSDIERELKKGAGKIEAIKGKVTKLREEIRTQRGLLSEAALEKKVESARNLEKDLKRTTEDERVKVQKLQKERIEKLVSQIDEIISELAEENGYSFVLEKNDRFVLYASKRIDITSEVVKRFDDEVIGR